MSPDGSAYTEALAVDPTTARVELSQGAVLGGLASDPATPQDGLVWYNATTAQLRARVGGITRQIGADSTPFVQPGTGDFVLTSMGSGGATGTSAGAANRLDIYPFNPRADLVIDQLNVNVSTAVASAQGKIIVYASDAFGRPTVRLFESAALDFFTTGFKSAAVSLTLRKGLTYWFGLRSSSTATVSSFLTHATPT